MSGRRGGAEVSEPLSRSAEDYLKAILEAAGGRVLTRDGAPLIYGKPGFRNPDFIARGRD